jgi:hypothetical protein
MHPFLSGTQLGSAVHLNARRRKCLDPGQWHGFGLAQWRSADKKSADKKRGRWPGGGPCSAQALLACAMALNLTIGLAAPPVIGTMVAQGSFRIDNSTVTGNATLFEGDSVETRAAASLAELSGGARVMLASDSRGKFFRNRIILEKGEGQIEKSAGFELDARGLTVRTEARDASARVALSGGTRVQVLALSGSFQVFNAQGVLVANLAAGRALEFEPQSSNGPSRLSGCLQRRGGRFLLTDETTNVAVELTGPGLGKEANNRIEAAGSLDPTVTPLPEASEVIRVTSVKRIGKACVTGAAAAAGAGGAPSGGVPGGGVPGGVPTNGAGGGGGAGGGAAAGAAGGAAAAHAIPLTTIAIIGGVAAAATVGGLAAAGKLPGQGSSSASLSR